MNQDIRLGLDWGQPTDCTHVLAKTVGLKSFGLPGFAFRVIFKGFIMVLYVVFL